MAAKKAKSNITEVESGIVSNWKKENSERLSDIKRVNEPLFNAIGMALSFINKKLGGTEITMGDIVVESPRVVGKLTDEQLALGVGIPRFKTEQELTDEYGFAWRDDVFNQFNDDWADELNSILGKPLEGMQFGLMKKAGSDAGQLIFDSNSNAINDIFNGYVRTGVLINGKYISIYPNIIQYNQEIEAVSKPPKAGEWYSIPSGNKLLYIESDDADDYDITEFSYTDAKGSHFAYEKQSFADAVIGGAYIKRPAPVFKMGTEILYESQYPSGVKMEDGEIIGYIGWDDKLGYEYWLRDTKTNSYFSKIYDGHNIVLKQSVTAAPVKRILEGFYASANENVYELSVNPKNPQEFITEIWDATAAETSYSYARMLELIEQQKLIRLPRAPLFKSGELLYVNGSPFNDDLQHKVFGITYLPNSDTFIYQMVLGDTYHWIPEEKLAYTPFNKSNNSVSLETKMPESSSSGNEGIDFDALADELENLDI